MTQAVPTTRGFDAVWCDPYEDGVHSLGFHPNLDDAKRACEDHAATPLEWFSQTLTSWIAFLPPDDAHVYTIHSAERHP